MVAKPKPLGMPLVILLLIAGILGFGLGVIVVSGQVSGISNVNHPFLDAGGQQELTGVVPSCETIIGAAGAWFGLNDCQTANTGGAFSLNSFPPQGNPDQFVPYAAVASYAISTPSQPVDNTPPASVPISQIIGEGQGAAPDNVVIRWNNPSPPDPTISHYVIYMSQQPFDNTNYQSLASPVGTVSSEGREFQYTGFSTSNLLYFSIQAVDKAGNKSTLLPGNAGTPGQIHALVAWDDDVGVVTKCAPNANCSFTNICPPTSDTIQVQCPANTIPMNCWHSYQRTPTGSNNLPPIFRIQPRYTELGDSFNGCELMYDYQSIGTSCFNNGNHMFNLGVTCAYVYP